MESYGGLDLVDHDLTRTISCQPLETRTGKLVETNQTKGPDWYSGSRVPPSLSLNKSMKHIRKRKEGYIEVDPQIIRWRRSLKRPIVFEAKPRLGRPKLSPIRKPKLKSFFE